MLSTQDIKGLPFTVLHAGGGAVADPGAGQARQWGLQHYQGKKNIRLNIV